MRASVQAGVGNAGASDVKANFERLGWGPVPNPEHDLGTDLLVQARDDRLFDRCAIVGVQVKAGASWFTDVVRDDDGELIGWSYYEPDTAHFDDWVVHGLPHLLVLHDLDTRVSYWVHVTAAVITVTGKGCKIVVPRDQVIDVEHRDALLEVAAQHRKPTALEGTVRSARMHDIPPGRRLRYALLVPRLVTPHRWRQGDGGVEPEEAIALLVQARLRDLDHIVGRGDSGSWWSEAAGSRDWRWRFAAAIRGFLTGADDVDLATHVADAPGVAQRAAATVVAACVLMDRERFDDAAALLSAAIDEASPVDHAWLLVQRARARAQVGDVDSACADAVDAQRALVGDSDDLTASAIGGAAAWLLFETAAWRDQNADEVLRASDTAVSWWRTQTLSRGLTAAVEHRYREWADDQATRIEFEDVVNNNLYSASWNAHLSGDLGTWRAVSSLLARNTLVAGDRDRSVDALDDLRRCGDDKSLSQAVRKLWSDGPLRVLAEACPATVAKPWSHTSARATMVIWQHAGDVLDTDHADIAARRCLNVLGDIPDFGRRLTPSFDVVSAVTDALFGLMHAASDDAHREVVDYLVALPPSDDQANARKVARVASRVRLDALSTGACDAVRDAAELQPDVVLSAQLLGLIANIDGAAKEELLTRIGRGDWDALAALGNVHRLTDDVAQQVIVKSADAVVRLIPKVGSGFSSSFFSHDPARTLASMNCWFPEHAQWDPLLCFLRSPGVALEQKRDACLVVAFEARHLPEEIRAALRGLARDIPGFTIGQSLVPLEAFARAGSVLAAAVGALDSLSLADTCANLLVGSRKDRRDAAVLMMLRDQPADTAALVSLLGDPHPEVRSQAVTALTYRIARPGADLDELALSGVRQAASGDGARLPLAIAAELNANHSDSPVVAVLAGPLRTHPSARVRREAAQIPHV